MSETIKYAIIVSGGTGSRMESQFPKQFIELKGLPILMHTIRAFHSSSNNIKIVLVLNELHKELWEELCLKHHFELSHNIVFGGKNRFNSVQNGLKYISEIEPSLDKVVIGIHDGVRPLINQETITTLYKQAEEKGSAIPYIKSKDSIRLIDDEGNNRSINRDSVVLIQTPQVFQAPLLHASYQHLYEDSFTDDASVIEKAGYPIHLIEGDIRNIKITYPVDLKIAEVLISKSN